MAKTIFKALESENLPIQHKPERFIVHGRTLIKKTNSTYDWHLTAPTKDSAHNYVFEDGQTKVTIIKITDLGSDIKNWKTFKIDELFDNVESQFEQETQNEFF